MRLSRLITAFLAGIGVAVGTRAADAGSDVAESSHAAAQRVPPSEEPQAPPSVQINIIIYYDSSPPRKLPRAGILLRYSNGTQLQYITQSDPFLGLPIKYVVEEPGPDNGEGGYITTFVWTGGPRMVGDESWRDWLLSDRHLWIGRPSGRRFHGYVHQDGPCFEYVKHVLWRLGVVDSGYLRARYETAIQMARTRLGMPVEDCQGFDQHLNPYWYRERIAFPLGRYLVTSPDSDSD